MVGNVVLGKKGFQTIPLAERFWSKVNKTDTCWLWTGAHDRHGYGQIWTDGRHQLAHVVSLALVGHITPAGLETDHLCRTPACVRPSHLEFVTHQKNNQRGDNFKRNLTHCLRGHPLSGANLYQKRGSTKRECRACRIIRHWERKARDAIEEARK